MITEVKLEYNPYKIETIITVNGKNIEEANILNKIKGNRLQYWLDKSKNWDGIISELSQYLNLNTYNLIFKGRKIDFEDLEIAVKKYSNNYNINLKYEKVEDDYKKISQINELIEELKNNGISEIEISEILKAYDDIKSSEFKINVIATMSSGKSTLINSILGKELLPSKNQACTATIARITDDKDIDKFQAECKDSRGNTVYKKQVIDLEKMREFNDDEKVTYIDIEGNMPNIRSQDLKLILIDTPGPNNSRNDNHKKLTEEIIKEQDNNVVLYIMNATQFGINDDKKLLMNIASSMKFGGKQSADRFLFAINKCDDIDVEKGDESIDELIANVKEYLQEFGIENPNIFPISAMLCKNIRKYKKEEELTRKELRELEGACEDFIKYEDLHFENMATLSHFVKNKINEKLETAINKEDIYEQALIHSGVPAIEETINEYLEKYAYPIKIGQAIDIIMNILKKIESTKQIQERILENKMLCETLEIEILGLKNRIDEVEKIKELTNNLKGIDVFYRILYMGRIERIKNIFKKMISVELGRDVLLVPDLGKKGLNLLINSLDSYSVSIEILNKNQLKSDNPLLKEIINTYTASAQLVEDIARYILKVNDWSLSELGRILQKDIKSEIKNIVLELDFYKEINRIINRINYYMFNNNINLLGEELEKLDEINKKLHIVGYLDSILKQITSLRKNNEEIKQGGVINQERLEEELNKKEKVLKLIEEQIEVDDNKITYITQLENKLNILLR